MNRQQAESYIAEKYNVYPEYPWLNSPYNGVFRHESNRKWFAIIMRITADKLGIENDNIIDVMNVKCDRLLIGSLLEKQGFFPAYHMNKSNWISIALDGSADDDTIRWLIDMSFAATAEKPERKIAKTESRVRRISRMEEYYETLCNAFESNREAIEKDASLQLILHELTVYYENGQWLADYEADEHGELPSDLKRGVLSQDALYNLLCGIEQSENQQS